VCHKVPFFAPVLYSLYINDAPSAPGVHLALFAGDTCVYATEKLERRVLNKLQRGLTAVGSWYQRWNIKIKEKMIHAIYFSKRCRMPRDDLQLNGRNIPFVNSVKYLGVIFDRRMTWRLHIEKIAAKALGTYISTYPVLTNKHLSTNIKVIVYRALMRSITTYAYHTWEFAADTHAMKLQRLQKRILRLIGKLDRRTPVRDLHLAFKIPYVYDYINLYKKDQPPPSVRRIIERGKKQQRS
jgi:hypothetical protein